MHINFNVLGLHMKRSAENRRYTDTTDTIHGVRGEMDGSKTQITKITAETKTFNPTYEQNQSTFKLNSQQRGALLKKT